MDRYTSIATRLSAALPFFGIWFVVGFAIAIWDPQPRLILTVSVGITMGLLVLGPYAAAALYGARLQRVLGGHLRWPLCLLMAGSAVLVLDYLLAWSPAQLGWAFGTAMAGTVLGHDATLSVLDLRQRSQLDLPMVLLFPALVGLAALSGYAAFGFAAGLYRFAAALAVGS